MSNKKETITESKATTKSTRSKAVANEETVELKKQLETEKQEKEDMKKQMEQLQQMVLQLQQSILSQSTTTTTLPKNEKVKIMSCAWGRLGLTDVNNSIIVDFVDSYIVETISYNMLQQILTTDNKNKFFKTGLVCFVGDSEKYYDLEGIEKPYILTKRNILNIYNRPYDQMVTVLNKLIDNNPRIYTCIFWQTVRMLAKNEVTEADLLNNINLALVQYFKCRSVESAKGQVNLAKDINFVK